MFLSLAEWSVGLTVSVLLSGQHSKQLLGSCFHSSVILGTLISILIFITSLFVPNLFTSLSASDAVQVSIALEIGALMAFFRIVQQFFIGIEQSKNKYSVQNSITTVYNFMISLGSVGIAIYNQSLVYIFSWQLIVTIFIVLVHLRYTITLQLINNPKQLMLWSTTGLIQVFRHSSRVWPSAFGSVLFTQGDRLILGNLLSPDLTGIYSALASIATQINALSALPIQPLITHLRSIKRDSRDNAYFQSIANAVFLNTAISTTIGVSLICFQSEIANLLLGNWLSSGNINILLSVIAGIYVIYSYNAVGYYILFAVNKELLNTVISILSSLITLGLIYILTTKYGVMGSILGNLGYWVSLSFLFYGFRSVSFPLASVSKVYALSVLALGLSFLSLCFEPIMIRFLLYIACLGIIFIANFSTLSTMYILNKQKNGIFRHDQKS